MNWLWPDASAWPIGTRVRKRGGGEWHGPVCGYYRTNLNPRGYCVESERERNSVQIYAEHMLEIIE